MEWNIWGIKNAIEANICLEANYFHLRWLMAEEGGALGIGIEDSDFSWDIELVWQIMMSKSNGFEIIVTF